MQDEINARVVALSVQTGKETARITTKVLQAAIRKYLEDHKQRNPTLTHGKQTVGQLMEQNTQLTNIEITDQNIKSFERVAKKYNIDFALKKDKTKDPPRYLIFFKARDAEVMDAAFNEYSAKVNAHAKRPSIRKLLAQSIQKAKHMQREKVKQKDRGQER